MTSWIFILSQFTAEALLYEATALFFLLALYAAFWILRKRRYGVIDNELPSGPVKAYLNELIVNAEELRTQLFGLLGGGQGHAVARNWMQTGGDGPALSAPEPKIGAPASSGSSDPELQKKVQALEAKLSDQTRSVEQLSVDKGRLERELAEAKSKPAAGGGEGGGDAAKLQAKVQELETKLAEYNVIEDDLANLKRLQQENAQLKAQLAGGGGAAAAAPVPAAAAPTPAPAAPASPAEDPLAGLAAQTAESIAPLASQESAAPAAAAPAAPAAPAAATPAAAAAAGDAAAAAAPADAGAGGGGAAASSPEKTDADLVAEFEKMLKG